MAGSDLSLRSGFITYFESFISTAALIWLGTVTRLFDKLVTKKWNGTLVLFLYTIWDGIALCVVLDVRFSFTVMNRHFYVTTAADSVLVRIVIGFATKIIGRFKDLSKGISWENITRPFHLLPIPGITTGAEFTGTTSRFFQNIPRIHLSMYFLLTTTINCKIVDISNKLRSCTSPMFTAPAWDFGFVVNSQICCSLFICDSICLLKSLHYSFK